MLHRFLVSVGLLSVLFAVGVIAMRPVAGTGSIGRLTREPGGGAALHGAADTRRPAGPLEVLDEPDVYAAGVARWRD